MKKFLLLIPRKLFLICLPALLTGLVKGQLVPPGREVIPVTIKVINPKKEPVKYATISVINRTDSTETVKKAADSTGNAVFQLKKGGQYTVSITSVNYQPVEKGIIVSGGVVLKTF